MDRSNLEQLAFRHDFNRALATRFAPRSKRIGLLTLLALDFELSKIEYATNDPILRRIKIQFWHEAIYDDRGAGLPVVGQLLACFSTNSKNFKDLEFLLTAHEKHLDQLSSAQSLYCGKEQCEAALFKLACNFLVPSSSPMNDAFFEQCGAVYDALSQLSGMMENADQEATKVRTLVEQTRHAYEVLHKNLRTLPVGARAGILPLALVLPYLDLYQTSDNKSAKLVEVHPIRRAFMMWRAIRSGFKLVK